MFAVGAFLENSSLHFGVENPVRNQFLLQRINQAALSLDHIKIDGAISIPQDDDRIPQVDIQIETNELAQRLDVTLMRLIAQVKAWLQ